MTTRLSIECLQVPFPARRSITFPSTEWTFEAHRPVLIVRGDNASGKTTFLNVLSGYLRPRHGHALLGETVLSGRGPTWAARLGVVRGFQSPLLCSDLRVWENIALPLLRNWWRPVGRFRPAVLKRLSEIGLDTLVDLSPAELSFGQRRLVELVRIQFQISEGDKRLALFDEPVAGLDITHRAEAFRIIRWIAGQGLPIILVEHDMQLGELADVSEELRLNRRDDGGRQFVVFETAPSSVPGGIS
jgi:ABC-type branched-subunit amino acid transport system ATPase component